MALEYFTLAHIFISLAEIASDFGVLSRLLAAEIFPRWTEFFLVTTVATSVTGFSFPLLGFTPALAVGIISLLALVVASYAFYARRLAGYAAT